MSIDECEVQTGIRPATEEDLLWLRNGLDHGRLAEMARVEIADALNSSSRPRQWRPVEIDEALLR
jgi:hypothetical protein